VLPYVEPPVLRLGGVAVPAFAPLVVAGALVGFELVVRRAPRYGIERSRAAVWAAWTLFLGFFVSHVFAEAAYHPERVRADPLVLLWFWGSMSSLGGMLGGTLAAAAFAWARRMPAREVWAFVDLISFAAPFGWTFGRLGCALAHDHPGIPSTHPLAVAFPDGPRFDLGLLELPLHVGLAVAFALLGRRSRPVGLYTGLYWSVYAPVRFGLDFLRVDETLYLGLTPAQFACALAGVAGVSVLARLARGARSSR
jgi:phosphatidylglycerol:prolipoprotein diacylglycerol transferase